MVNPHMTHIIRRSLPSCVWMFAAVVPLGLAAVTACSDGTAPVKSGQVLEYNQVKQCNQYLSIVPQTAADTSLYNQCIAHP